jgi:hypothetical protein
VRISHAAPGGPSGSRSRRTGRAAPGTA